MSDASPTSGLSRLRAVLAALTTGVLVLAVGLVTWGLLDSGDGPTEAPADVQRPTYASVRPAQPLRLEVPSLGIEAPILPIGLTAAAELIPPANPIDVGWWEDSARPGDGRGQTVVTGHTVHTGGGAMDRLREVERNSVVDVETRAGTVRYRVDRTVVLSRAQVAARAQSLFGQGHGEGRLVLVTCTDWNGIDYESNVIVFGRPLGQPVTDRAPASDSSSRAVVDRRVWLSASRW